jgi:Flp pilus assembly pilin Flp
MLRNHAVATVKRLQSDESGQDIVEYALLGALIGISSILIWQGLVTSVFNVYTAADAGVQNVSACTPDPGGGGCP